MLVDDFISYFNCIDSLEAIERLNEIGISSYPWMKKTDRKKISDQLNKKAKLRFDDEGSKIISTEEVARQLARRLMGG